jgi:hypothetical protein
MGFYSADDPEVDPERLLAHVQALQGFYAEDREFTITREYVARIMLDASDPRSEYWDLMKRGTLPPDALLARRMEGLTLGVLGQLNATANWHRIVNEWLYDGPPATPLGEAEAAAGFQARRAMRRAA